MKQKTKKLLQLSFSLGFLATTALVATSCKQPMTVAPKPTDPSKPTNPKNPSTGNPEEPSTPTEPVKPTEPAKPVDTTEVKNKLKEVISKKDEKLAMYADYSVIKGELEKVYSAAELVSKKDNATEEELTDAKNKLDAAIKTAETSKTDFDSKNSELVGKFNDLKGVIKTLDFDSWKNEPKYEFIKKQIEEKYNSSKSIINNGVQSSNLNVENINTSKDELSQVIADIQNKKKNADEIDSGKFYGIDKDKIMSATADDIDTNNQYKNSLWAANVTVYHKYTVRKSKLNANWIVKPNSVYVGDLSGDDKKYVFSFDNYSSETLYLYFFYKVQREPGNSDKFDYQVKVNGQEIEGSKTKLTDSQISSYANVQKIYLAKIPLTGLKFGNNMVEIIKARSDRTYKNILFGGISLLRDPGANNENEEKLIYKINGQSKNDNGIIKVSVFDAVGASTSLDTYFENIGTQEQPITVLKSIGHYGTGTNDKATYYLGLYAPQDGEYKIGADYNSNEDSMFEVGYFVKPFNMKNNEIKLTSIDNNSDGKVSIQNDLKTDATNKIKTIDVNTSKIKINLKKGWNNIILANKDMKSPNIQNIYLKKE
ncbi:hypothetical protein [Mycoplasma bradburyae]|uniref:hypothetical protein n=1 Tax=Mycoplasma bradburyae TaxID=2963128 RepID=UPI002341C992|nr:hypothetical protein [Mycoplasma bradburyae]MDC4183015.1 hypothetical protein [Mycoplasma bradburyae]